MSRQFLQYIRPISIFTKNSTTLAKIWDRSARKYCNFYECGVTSIFPKTTIQGRKTKTTCRPWRNFRKNYSTFAHSYLEFYKPYVIFFETSLKLIYCLKISSPWFSGIILGLCFSRFFTILVSCFGLDN